MIQPSENNIVCCSLPKERFWRGPCFSLLEAEMSPLGQQQLLPTDINQIVDGFKPIGNPSFLIIASFGFALGHYCKRGALGWLEILLPMETKEDQKAAYVADSIMLSNMLSFFDNDNKLVDESDIAYEKAIDNTSPLSTQEIKNRLEILDRKSPFNFEYNKQLERVIVHYLKDKRSVFRAHDDP